MIISPADCSLRLQSAGKIIILETWVNSSLQVAGGCASGSSWVGRRRARNENLLRSGCVEAGPNVWSDTLHVGPHRFSPDYMYARVSQTATHEILIAETRNAKAGCCSGDTIRARPTANSTRRGSLPLNPQPLTPHPSPYTQTLQPNPDTPHQVPAHDAEARDEGGP